MLDRHFSLLLLFPLLLMTGNWLNGQSETDPDALKAALEKASTEQERYGIYFQLTTQLTKLRDKEAPFYGEKTHNSAKKLRNKQLIADAAWLTAKAYDRLRNSGKTEYWRKTTMQAAISADDPNLLLEAVKVRALAASRKQNYQRAAGIYKEALDYFSKDGNDIGDLRARNQLATSRLEAERKALEKQRADLADELEILREEQEILEEENDQLLEASESKTKELAARSEALKEVQEAKANVEERMADAQRAVSSLTRDALEKELVVKRAEEELKEKEAEAREAELRAAQAELVSAQSETLRNYAFGAGLILLLLSALLYYRFVSKRKSANALAQSNEELDQSRKQSDDLLRNILPAAIAQELKETGTAKARKYNDTTILFSDFVNFTQISEQLGPEDLVRELDVCFKGFDDILNDYPTDVEKIKTIGDAYMVASGLDDRKSVPANLIRTAIRMQQFLKERADHRKSRGLPFFEARIGLHTGPVVAGVVGKKKFAYDVWGDTVNTAARVETQSEPGKVNVSETTYRLIKYQFECDYRGKVQAKNKGFLDMYFVKGEL